MPEIIVENGPQKGQRFTLEPPGPFVCGRDSAVSVPVRDPMVSRSHFRIELENNTYYLLDSGSANGTYLNGLKRERHVLATGDRIKVGETLLTFFPDKVDDHLIGKTISGFEVLERIGQGGMGTVYKARQVSLDRLVALKVLSKDLAENRTFTEAFHREARAAGQINHPSIVQVYDVDTIELDGEEITFFAMEFMPSGSVEDLLNKEKKIDQERALEVALDTARGLQFAETRGLVHRDIKPGNIMVSESGIAKIGDLGIARMSDSGAKVSQKDGVSGSPHYISPEQARGEDLDSGADMYSLGVSLYHMLAGRPPYAGSNAKELILKHLREPFPDVRERCPEVHPAVEALLERMTRKDRRDRHPDAAALVEDIHRTLARVRGLGPAAERSGSRRALFIAGVVLVVLAVGAIAGIAITVYHQHAQRVATELAAYKDALRDELDGLQEAIEARELERATAHRASVDRLIASTSQSDVEVGELHTRYDELTVLLNELETETAAAARETAARAAFAEIAEKLPADPANVTTTAALDGHIATLEAFVDEHADTAIANEATARIEALGEARRELARTLRRARDAFASLSGRVDTYLGFNPPSFKSALAALRDFAAEFPAAPESERATERAATTEKRMIEHVERAAAELAAADESTRPQVLLRLQRLRLEVEGEGARIVEEALAGAKE